MNIFIALLVTVAMAAVDFCQSQYTNAITRKMDDKPRPDTLKAMFWSVGQWGAATVGFVVAVKLSMWYLPFEAAGLALGTFLGARRLEKQVPQATVVSGRRWWNNPFRRLVR